ncbi:MAG: NAD-dependent succinate-semialdehyde dehydrogenase [Bauldia sp.]|nr:MAG: NAD-dependent succinate-semialdehyde dehydrogenase [Bauldia sp.]
MDTELFIDGHWRQGRHGYRLPVLNPATEETLGEVARATIEDLDEALVGVAAGFSVWRARPAIERYRIMRKAADLLRQREEDTARTLTTEHGKPLAEARAEVLAGADTIDWFAEEARRVYGRIIPARAAGVQQLVMKEPVGPVAAFSPWNFPINQAVRNISAALAAGCSIVIKGPEETPATCAALVHAFADAGVPPGVLNLVFGVPAEISSHLIASPVIRKISFTGSTAVGKQLASLAGLHMKRVTMELGGHAPAIVFADADVDKAAAILSANKFRNAGQVCVSPTRFLVQDSAYDAFVDKFVAAARAIRVGDGLHPDTQMGPLAHTRRIEAMQRLVSDAVQRGAKVETGGERISNKGYFFAPTVLTDVAIDSLIMNEEPFGPLAPISRFSTFDEAITEANRLPYGLASYVYTRSLSTASAAAEAIEAGVVSTNHHGVALIETPFGGIKDSGYGSEGGSEAMEPYLVTKFVTQATADEPRH